MVKINQNFLYQTVAIVAIVLVAIFGKFDAKNQIFIKDCQKLTRGTGVFDSESQTCKLPEHYAAPSDNLDRRVVYPDKLIAYDYPNCRIEHATVPMTATEQIEFNYMQCSEDNPSSHIYRVVDNRLLSGTDDVVIRWQSLSATSPDKILQELISGLGDLSVSTNDNEPIHESELCTVQYSEPSVIERVRGRMGGSWRILPDFTYRSWAEKYLAGSGGASRLCYPYGDQGPSWRVEGDYLINWYPNWFNGANLTMVAEDVNIDGLRIVPRANMYQK